MIGKGIGDSLTSMIQVFCIVTAVACLGIGYGIAQLIAYLF